MHEKFTARQQCRDQPRVTPREVSKRCPREVSKKESRIGRGNIFGRTPVYSCTADYSCTAVMYVSRICTVQLYIPHLLVKIKTLSSTTLICSLVSVNGAMKSGKKRTVQLLSAPVSTRPKPSMPAVVPVGLEQSPLCEPSAENGGLPPLELPPAMQEPSSRVSVPNRPQQNSTESSRPLLSNSSSVNVDEEFGDDEKLLNDFVKRHPMLRCVLLSLRPLLNRLAFFLRAY